MKIPSPPLGQSERPGAVGGGDTVAAGAEEAVTAGVGAAVTAGVDAGVTAGVDPGETAAATAGDAAGAGADAGKTAPVATASGDWRGSAGRVTVNIEPLPTRLSTMTRPPCISTTERTIARPSPLPLPRASLAR